MKIDDTISPTKQGTVSIEGHCEPALAALKTAFAENFAHSGELGAALAIEIDGRVVVDLWGGWMDPERTRPWQRDTTCVVFSNTKPATALCAHLLAEQGALELDRPVGDYWPAFRALDKRDITTRMLLDHSAGLPALREPLPDDAAFDWGYMVWRLERETPFWAPGTRVAYHGMTFGWLVGEIVRRVGGCPLGEFFARHIAQPLALDFWIGLPEHEEPRVATIVAPARADAACHARERDLVERPDSPAALSMKNTGGWRPSRFNSRIGHAAQLGAAGGIANARSLARLYGTLAMGGARDGVRLLREATLERAIEVSAATHDDACLRVPTRFASGFMREMDNRARGLDSAAFGRDAFGHVGAGGSLAFASRSRRLGFAYVMNRMGSSVLLDERAERLVRVLYDALDANR